jgi:nucleoside-triphosphatase
MIRANRSNTTARSAVAAVGRFRTGGPEVPLDPEPSDQVAGSRNVLLVGRPGVGKTTVMMRLADLVQDRPLAGFYTDEIRQGGRRQGFRATTVSGETTILAHLEIKSRRRVGRYGVDVAAFEKLVLPELAKPAELILVDEIGKMECFSSPFVETVGTLLDSRTAVVATVALKGGGFIGEVKARPDVEVWEVTESNRDELSGRLVSAISGSAG